MVEMLISIFLVVLAFAAKTCESRAPRFLNLPLINSCALPIPISSGQWAILCRLPDPDSAINYMLNGDPNFVDLSLLSPLDQFLVKETANVTANMLCDTDCRCIHGCKERGGRCGLRPGEKDQSKKFCICDYDEQPPRSLPVPLDENCVLGKSLRTLCPLPVTGPYLDNFCNIDCVCSHGYPDSPKMNRCFVNTTIGSEPQPFCLCNGRKNIPGS